MSFDFSLSPKPLDTEHHELFMRYFQTGRHPDLRVPVHSRNNKQTKITDFFSPT
jgi:hypothetical protein